MSRVKANSGWLRFLTLAVIVWLLGSVFSVISMFFKTILKGEAVFDPGADWSSLAVSVPLATIGVMSFSWLPALIVTAFLWWRLAPNHRLQLTGDARE